MAVLTQRISNLVGGVSQQTPELRLPNQCSSQLNCWNDAVTGMRKRPSTVAIRELNLADTPANTKFHTHVISETERYIVAVSDKGLQVFDAVDGTEYSVDDSDDNTYIADKGSYSMMTVGDDVFVLNKDRQVALKDVSVTNPPVNTSYTTTVWTFKQASGTPKNGYSVKVGNSTYYKFGKYTVKTTYTGDGRPNGSKLIYDTPEDDAKKLETALKAQYPSESITRVGASVTWSGLTSVGVFVVSSKPEFLSSSSKSEDVQISGAETGIAYIVQPDYEVTYSIKLSVDGIDTPFFYEHKTPSSTSSGARSAVATYYILDKLIDKIKADEASHKITARRHAKNCLLLTRTPEEDAQGKPINWKLSADDDLDGKAIVGFRHQLRNETDLPPDVPVGYEVSIVVSTNADPYYLKYEENEDGDGAWVESIKRGDEEGLDETTMPHLLRRTYDDSGNLSFVLETREWANRQAGDKDTAPRPSFCNKKITAMSLVRGRLVFATGNQVMMSEVNNDLNFYPTSVVTVIESDPIDLSLDSPESLDIQSITSDNEILIMWDDSVQMGLQYDGSSWTANEVSAYNVDAVTTPKRIGSVTYYSGYEFGRSQIGAHFRSREQLYESVDTTAHVPTYIQLRAKYITGNSVDSYVALCGENGGGVYVYNFRQQGTDLVQSAWSKWEVGDGVHYIQDTHGELQLIVSRPDGKIYLETMDLQSPNKVLLDSLTVHDSKPTATDGKKVIRYDGKWYMGWSYMQSYEFSPIYYRFNNETQTDATLMLRKMALDYEDTVGFDFSVTNRGNVKTKSLKMIKGLPSLLSGYVEHKRGQFSMLTRGNSENLTLTITNNEPYNCNIVSATWTGSYHKRTR